MSIAAQIAQLATRVRQSVRAVLPLPSKSWWPYIHLIALLGLSMRLLVVFTSDHIFHPDEVYQYLEQGHRIVYGYGYVPWEYRFGTRSWIIPGIIAFLLSGFRAIGIDDPNIYVPMIRVFFCLLSLSLIYGLYVIGRNIVSEPAGRLAAVFASLWYELVYFAHKPTPEVLAAYLLVGAMGCAVVRTRKVSVVMCGIFGALTVAIRPQYVPFIAALGLFVGIVFQPRDALKALVAFVAIAVAVGWIDYLTWGFFMASYYNNYLFNVVYGVADIFGQQPLVIYYPAALIIASAGTFCMASLISIFRSPGTWIPLVCVAALVFAHTLIGHKEYRFIFAAIPLLILTSAVTASGKAATSCVSTRRTRYFVIVVGLAIISYLGFFRSLPFQYLIYKEPLWQREDINKAFLFLHNEPDLVAVYNASVHWAFTGGYYYLHRDVPIYLPSHLEAKGVELSNLDKVVSHIVSYSTAAPNPGFKTAIRFGKFEVRKAIHRVSSYTKLDIDTRNVLKNGIDGIYHSTVRPTL